ncbi:hypothetical protein GJ699_27565 [Duganella sp. FT80W]|uniref:Uncharacterized protein n=1 Tax=Duganella guangzhouensis TaxID=2666084 RepID=A0A6I2LBX4_9BURK|nr:hypothetical protein [Duganella guangzhouensis]MRW93759.1 hypothetical protein [Duganella guangzhouensis]
MATVAKSLPRAAEKCCPVMNRYFRAAYVENTGICLETGPFFRFFTRFPAGLAVWRERHADPTSYAGFQRAD